MPIFDKDDSEEEKSEVQDSVRSLAKPAARPKPKPAPAKKQDDGGDDPDDFKNRLAAMLARGPGAIARAPARPAAVSMQQTPEEILDAKLSVPGLARKRNVTTKYAVEKYDFEGF